MKGQLLPRSGVLVGHGAPPGCQVRFVDAKQNSLLVQGDYGRGQTGDLSCESVKALFLLPQNIEIACFQALPFHITALQSRFDELREWHLEAPGRLGQSVCRSDRVLKNVKISMAS